MFQEDIPSHQMNRSKSELKMSSLMDVAAVIIAEKELDSDETRKSPIPFSIEYDESKIQ